MQALRILKLPLSLNYLCISVSELEGVAGGSKCQKERHGEGTRYQGQQHTYTEADSWPEENTCNVGTWWHMLVPEGKGVWHVSP